MIHNNSTPEIVFTNMGRKYGLCRVRNLRAITAANTTASSVSAMPAVRQVPILSKHDTHYFSRLLHNVKLPDLRNLLSDDPTLFHSSNEKQVLDRIASLLKSGSIILLELAIDSLPDSKPTFKNPERKVEEEFEYVDIKHMPSSSELAINQPPTPKAPQKSGGLALDEKVLIGVLTAAAVSGVALCEMCSKQGES